MGIRELTEEDRNEILNVNRGLIRSGLRVLAFAYKELNQVRN